MDLAAAVAELKRSTDTFGPFIRAQAERISDRVALRFEDDTVTYGAYDRAVNRMAARLGREGVARGTPVALLAPNSPLFLVALGAVAKLGAIGALINTHVTGAGLTHVLRASGAAIGVSDAAALPALDLVAGSHPVRFLADAPPATALPRDVRPLEGWRDGPEAPEPDVPDVRGGDVFLYIYTSGTTGYPKPAVVRHLRFTMGGITLAGLLGVETGETIYAPLPLYHGESLFVGFAPAFRAGGAFASRRRFSASAFLDDVRRHQAVAFVYVGELCRYLLRLPPARRASGSSCTTPSRAAMPGSAPGTCCARTPTATTTSSIASATPSAGRARTSPRRRSPTSSAERPGSRRRTCTAWRCRARTAARAWQPSCSPGARASTARRCTRAPSGTCRPTLAPPSSAWCPRWT